MVIPRPNPCFLDGCVRLGYIYGEQRWQSPCGAYLFTWDGLHGEIEQFTIRGKHYGVVHPVTGISIKPAVKGRKINV